MHSTLTLPAAAERAAIASRHGWGPQPGPAGLAALATAQAGLHAARLLTPYVTAHTRLPEFRADDLRHALSPHGTLVKVRCVRRTLHCGPTNTRPTPTPPHCASASAPPWPPHAATA
ncbi:hypothetical protein [Streptomyces chrestomyceticus]|uniref:hypothetical protein n=1 Tax=Streptomyces chrestomyceticus TaxID=68185 RepID=UPI0034025CEC